MAASPSRISIALRIVATLLVGIGGVVGFAFNLRAIGSILDFDLDRQGLSPGVPFRWVALLSAVNALSLAAALSLALWQVSARWAGLRAAGAALAAGTGAILGALAVWARGVDTFDLVFRLEAEALVVNVVVVLVAGLLLAIPRRAA
jgi:hypothetical protein